MLNLPQQVYTKYHTTVYNECSTAQKNAFIIETDCMRLTR